MRRATLCCSLALAAALGGCGTTLSVVFGSGGSGQHGRLWRGGAFGGVTLDGFALLYCVVVPFPGWLGLPFVLVDLPLSFVADLLIAPIYLIADRAADHPAPPDPPPAAPPRPRPRPPEAQPAPGGRPVARAEGGGPPRLQLQAGAAAPPAPPQPPPAWREVLRPRPWPAPPPGDGLVDVQERDLDHRQPAAVEPWAAVARTGAGLRLASVSGRHATVVRGEPRGPAVLAAAVGADGVAVVGHGPAVLGWSRPGGTSRGPTSHARAAADLQVVGVGACRDGVVVVEPRRTYLVQPGGRVRALSGHAAGGYAVATAPAAGWAAVGGWDGVVRLHDLRGGAPVCLDAGAPAWASAALAQDDARLVVGHADGTLVRWELATRRCTRLGADAGGVLALATSPDGALLVSAGLGPEVVVRDLASGRTLARLRPPGLEGPVVALAFGRDPRTVLVGSYDGAVRWLDATTGAEVDRLDLRPLDDAPRALGVDRDEVVIVTRRGAVLRYRP